MKTTLLLTAALLGAGCTLQSPTPQTRTGNGLLIFNHEGHSYLAASYSGGLLHSSSCTNTACVPMTLEQLRNFKPIVTPSYQLTN